MRNLRDHRYKLKILWNLYTKHLVSCQDNRREIDVKLHKCSSKHTKCKWVLRCSKSTKLGISWSPDTRWNSFHLWYILIIRYFRFTSRRSFVLGMNLNVVPGILGNPILLFYASHRQIFFLLLFFQLFPVYFAALGPQVPEAICQLNIEVIHICSVR